MEPLRHLSLPQQITRPQSSGAPEKARLTKANALARPNYVRVAIRLLAFIIGTSIVGVLAHSAAVWYSTRNAILKQPHGFRMRAWPARMDLIPTWIMLAVAVVAIFVQVVALLSLIGGVSKGTAEENLLTSFQVRRLRESNAHRWVVFGTSCLGVALWIAAAVYFKIQDSKGWRGWTLFSWSCEHTDLITGKMSFEAMCVRMVSA
jgi:hypothetical protein